MDYLKVYEHFYEKAHNTAKRMVMAEMKKSKEKHRPFLNVHNNISAFLYKYVQEKYSNRLSQTFQDSYSLFNNRHSYYEGDDSDVINFILSDEILHSFHKNYSSSYTAFIADLAIEASIKEAQRHYRNYHDYYQLIYDLDMYENFFFKDFKGIRYTSSSYYKKMMDNKYPHLKTEREETQELEKSNHNQNDSIPKKTDTKEFQINEVLNSFTDDEKYVLINLMYSLISNKGLKQTDFMKLVKIVGTYEDNEIFIKIPKSVTSYSKVSKGIEYYTSLNTRIETIDRILGKLSVFKIVLIEQELKKIKVNVLKEMA